MWRTAVLLLCLCLTQAEITERAFKPGREYVFRYEGQLISGIPEQFKDAAGMKITANAIFQFQLEENKVLMQLDDIDLFKILEKVDHPNLQLPLEWWSKVTGPEINDFVTELKKPIRFVYRWGEVLDLEADTWDPLPSINIKRGILNLLQVTWRHDEVNTQHQLPSTLLWPTDPKGYKIIEKGIAGECETVYVVAPSDREDFDSNISVDDRWTVWKTKNLQNCLTEPTSWKDKDPILKSTSLTKMIVQGTREEFLIERVWAEGEHMPLPWTSMPTDVNVPTTVLPVTFVNQSLWLTSSGRPVDPIDAPAVWEKRASGLKFERSWGEWETQATTDIHQWKLDEFDTILAGVVDGFRPDSISKETPVNFWLVVKKLREFNGAEIARVLTAFAVRPGVDVTEDQERRWGIILDALPHVGTEEAITTMLDWIEKKWIEGMRANQILATMAWRHPWKVDTVEKLWDTCSAEQMLTQPWVRSTCWLTWGNWVHKLCITSNKCTDAQRLAFQRTILGKITPDRPRDELHLWLKVAGNAGLPETFDDLVKLARTEEIPMVARTQALFSLRKMSPVFPEKVAVILAPIVFDTKADAELRISAFLLFLTAKPSQSSFLHLGRILESEPNKQVACFIWTTLHSVSQLRHPFWRKSAEHAKLALRLTKQHNGGWLTSRAWMKDWKTDNGELGAFADIGLIGLPSVVPRGMAARLGFIWKEKPLDFAEVGFRQEGMANFVEKWFGRKPVTGVEKMLKKPGRKEDFEGIDGIASTLGVKARKPEKPWLSLYMKIWGDEWWTWSIDSATVAQWWTNWGGFDEIARKLNEPWKTRVEKSFVIGEGATRAMTEMGIPITWNLTSTAIVSADVEATLKWDPKWTEEKSWTKIQNIEGSLKSTPKVVVWVNAFFGADAHVLHTGLGVQGTSQMTAPINPVVTFDVKQWKLKWSQLFDDVEWRLVDMKWKPFTSAWWGREQLEEEETGWVARHTPTNKMVKVIQNDHLPKAYVIPIAWPEWMKRELTGAGRCTPMTNWPEWCGLLSGPLEWGWFTRPTPGWTQTELNFDAWWSQKTRATLVGQEWRALEDTCTDKNRPLDVWALQFSYVKPDAAPEILWDLEWNMDWRDDKYKSSEWKFSTFRPDNGEPWKWCWQGEYLRPSWILEEPVNEIKAWWHVQAGKDCENDIKWDVEMINNKTDEQVRDENDRNTWQDELCEREKQRGREYAFVCVDLAMKRSRLNRFNFIVNTESLPASWTKWGDWWVNLLKYELWWNWSWSRDMPWWRSFLWTGGNEWWWNRVWGDRPQWQWQWQWQAETKKWIIVEELDLSLRNTNMTIWTPTERAMFENINWPFELPTMSTKRSIWDQLLLRSMDWKAFPSCKVMGDDLKTFDNFTFEHTWSERDFLLSMDCTPDETFAITAARRPEHAGKFVRVFLENKKVEILPANTGSPGFIVRIDGQHKPLIMNERMWVRPNGDVEIEALDTCGRKGTRDEAVEGLDKWAEWDWWTPKYLFEIRHMRGHIELIAEHLGLLVKFDGNNIKVQGSPFLQGKLCGLCGNFDQEWWNEWVGPNGLPARSLRKFTEGYHLTDAWWEANRIQP